MLRGKIIFYNKFHSKKKIYYKFHLFIFIKDKYIHIYILFPLNGDQNVSLNPFIRIKDMSMYDKIEAFEKALQ